MKDKHYACAHSSMAPDEEYLTCYNEKAGAGFFGTYLRGSVTLTGKLSACGEERKLFEQHPLRNDDGTLKGKVKW